LFAVMRSFPAATNTSPLGALNPVSASVTTAPVATVTTWILSTLDIATYSSESSALKAMPPGLTLPELVKSTSVETSPVAITIVLISSPDPHSETYAFCPSLVNIVLEGVENLALVPVPSKWAASPTTPARTVTLPLASITFWTT